MRKRLLAALLCLLMVLPAMGALAQEQWKTLPEHFKVSFKQEERMLGDKEQFIYKEYLRTSNKQVNEALREIVDGFDATYTPQVPPDPSRNARRNNRLDIETTYYRTGQSWLSTLISARIQAGRSQVMNPFTTRTYDLKTGQRVLLSDIFPEGSAAWDLLAERTASQLRAVFPGLPRDEAAIAALTEKDALAQAEFTLGGMELTLHYEARALLPEQVGLIHVRFFYPELAGMMSEAAALQTDNRHWKMVAFTADDGPKHNNSIKALNAYRQGGARVTFFEVGKVMEEAKDILQRQFDANHVIASHGFNHWSGYSMGEPARHREIAQFNELLTRLVGEPARLFRAPGGTYPPWIEARIGLPLIQWSLDTYDYTGTSARNILGNVRKFVKDGDIILMHDTGDNLFKAIPDVCEYLSGKGYLMVSVEELALAQGVALQPDTIYFRFVQGDYSPRKDSNTN